MLFYVMQIYFIKFTEVAKKVIKLFAKKNVHLKRKIILKS